MVDPFLIQMISKAYHIARILSLDVVLGAIVLSRFIAWYLGASFSWIIDISLGLAVWVIYTWDHLSDATKVSLPSTDRHKFHKKYRRVLTIFLIAAVLCGSSLMLFLPYRTLQFGIFSGGLVLIYFLLIQLWPKFHYKEILSALVYSIGVFVGPVSMYGGKLYLIDAVIFFQVLLIAFFNLLVFSDYEREKDQRDGHLSLVLHLGEKYDKVIVSLLLLQGLLSIWVFTAGLSSTLVVVEVIFLLMHLVLISIHFKQEFFSHKEKYRVLGDAIFFLPLPILLF